jgi:hypothetical protein
VWWGRAEVGGLESASWLRRFSIGGLESASWLGSSASRRPRKGFLDYGPQLSLRPSPLCFTRACLRSLRCPLPRLLRPFVFPGGWGFGGRASGEGEQGGTSRQHMPPPSFAPSCCLMPPRRTMGAPQACGGREARASLGQAWGRGHLCSKHAHLAAQAAHDKPRPLPSLALSHSLHCHTQEQPSPRPRSPRMAFLSDGSAPAVIALGTPSEEVCPPYHAAPSGCPMHLTSEEKKNNRTCFFFKQNGSTTTNELSPNTVCANTRNW